VNFADIFGQKVNDDNLSKKDLETQDKTDIDEGDLDYSSAWQYMFFSKDTNFKASQDGDKTITMFRKSHYWSECEGMLNNILDIFQHFI
jgi:hypothetical protein